MSTSDVPVIAIPVAKSDLPAVGTACTRAEMLASADSRTRRAAVLRASGGGAIVGLALTSSRNPRAPQLMVVGSGDRPAREAAQMVEAAVPVPVWVRSTESGPWVYAGLFRPARLDVSARGRKAGQKGMEDAVGVVRLTACDAGE